jgi:hypothetical protein
VTTLISLASRLVEPFWDMARNHLLTAVTEHEQCCCKNSSFLPGFALVNCRPFAHPLLWLLLVFGQIWYNVLFCQTLIQNAKYGRSGGVGHITASSLVLAVTLSGPYSLYLRDCCAWGRFAYRWWLDESLQSLVSFLSKNSFCVLRT